MEAKDLNIIPSGEMPVIHASQFDINRTLKFNLKEDGEDYELDAGISISCAIKKVDGNLVTFEVTNTEDKYIELTLPEQATACAGINVGEVIFTDSDNYEIGSINFILDVERSPKQGGIESASAIHDLTDQINEITIEVITTNPDIIATLKEEIDVPTKTSQLQNDSGYITSNDIPAIPTKTSQLQNDSGYITSNDIPSIPSDLNDLSDVNISSPTNGQILKYNSTSEKFENANESGGGGSTIEYSTTEHEVGLWLDGTSKVYEQSIPFSGTIGSSYTTVISTSDLANKKLLDVSFQLYDESGNAKGNFYYGVNVSGALNIKNDTGTAMLNISGYITIRYIKTA